MSRMQQCYFCSSIIDEPEYFLRPDDDVINYEVNACHDCYEKRTNIYG